VSSNKKVLSIQSNRERVELDEHHIAIPLEEYDPIWAFCGALPATLLSDLERRLPDRSVQIKYAKKVNNAIANCARLIYLERTRRKNNIMEKQRKEKKKTNKGKKRKPTRSPRQTLRRPEGSVRAPD